jgi:hypothetical protein
MHNAPSPQLIQQWIRNRIFEYLEGVAEYPQYRGAWDLNELINEWEMWVNDPFRSHDFPPPAFSVEEVTAMEITHDSWLRFADATPPKSIGDEDAARSLPEWFAFVGACSAAIKIFQVRGRLPEDAEIGDDA